jgi:hypothetical protein
MSPALHKDPVEETLLLFGPQIARIVPARLSELRNTIISNPKLAFLKDIIKTLPHLWKSTILTGCSQLKRLTLAGEQIEELVRFFDTGATDALPTPTPYELFLVPLTVISQIAEYISLEGEGPVQGFCVGFLAAAAVASSQNSAELEHYTATAVRLALCIGAVVDLDERERSGNRSSTWSVRYTSGGEEEHFRRTLTSFPEASELLCTRLSCTNLL